MVKKVFIHDLIWIGKIKDKDENDAYLNLIKREFKEIINRIKFIQFNDNEVEKGVNYIIESLKFKVIIVIINGSLFDSYINLLSQKIDELCCFPLSIIFTRNKSEFENNCINIKKLNDSLYNPGGVFDYFNPIIDFMKKYVEKEVPRRPRNSRDNPKDYAECYSFEYIEKGAQLIYPYLYHDIINQKKIEDNDINKFNSFLVEQFSLNESIEPLTIINNLNQIILSKFYVRAYTSENPFYRNLNWDLMRLEGKDYFPFIKVLYSRHAEILCSKFNH